MIKVSQNWFDVYSNENAYNTFLMLGKIYHDNINVHG